MSLDPADVKKIAHLARLSIEEQDIPDYANRLSAILQLVEQMNKQDTDGIQTMAHPLDLPQRQRKDIVTENDQHERFQQNAPQVEQDLYLVPKVIE